MPPDAEVIEAGTKALESASKPLNFQTLVAILALLGAGYLIWRTERRADAQIEVFQAIRDELRDMHQDFIDAGISKRHVARQ